MAVFLIDSCNFAAGRTLKKWRIINKYWNGLCSEITFHSYLIKFRNQLSVFNFYVNWFHENTLSLINEYLIPLGNFRAYRAHLYRRSCLKFSVYVQQASSSSNVVKENPGCVRVSNRASLWGVKRSRAEGPTKLNIAMVCPQCACNNNHTHRWCVYYE